MLKAEDRSRELRLPDEDSRSLTEWTQTLVKLLFQSIRRVFMSKKQLQRMVREDRYPRVFLDEYGVPRDMTSLEGLKLVKQDLENEGPLWTKYRALQNRGS